jgi:predicted ArsR family transcriptional regulator
MGLRGKLGRKRPIGETQKLVLTFIEQQPGVSAAEAASAVGITRSSVLDHLHALVKKRDVIARQYGSRWFYYSANGPRHARARHDAPPAVEVGERGEAA